MACCRGLCIFVFVGPILTWFTSPLTCERLPSGRNRAKMAEKWLLASPGNWAEKRPKNGKNGPIFPIFRHFFPQFPGEAKSIFRPFFPDFGPKARRQSLAGQWDLNTWWTFRIFFFFSARGREVGVRGAGRGVGAIFNGKSQEGGLLGGWGRGAEGPWECLWGILRGGGALNIFFSGPKFPPSLPSRPKLLQKVLFKNNCFSTVNFVKMTKQSLCKANSFACSLANRDEPVAATLQRKCSGRIIFIIVT